jgi:multidrug efflux pump subunit AcrB/ABC-type multidrug transport system ATPase subunit|tara:strand:- start:2045 stop:6739 length:4695 start_codon:yes stop_codon:yes gene_type:complete
MISNLAIRRPVTTGMFFIAIGMLGVVSLGRLSVELMPEVVFPEIFIVANKSAMSPEQIEREVVMPIEEEVGKLENVVQIDSQSRLANGRVTIAYEPSTDMRVAELQVNRRMSQLLPTLPEQTTLTVQRFDTSILTSAVMTLQVLGTGDLNWLRDFTEEKIRPELEAVDGVVSATPLGGQQRSIEIIVDPELLAAHQLSMNAITGAINSVNVPRAYVGRVFDANQRFPVSVSGQFAAISEVHNVVVRQDGQLTLGDIAEINYGLQERTDYSRVNGLEAVSIRIQKENEGNLISIAENLLVTVERLNRQFAAEEIEITVTDDQAEIMQEALGTLQRAAVIGVFLGLGVLFLFLRSARFVGILLLAIPSSLLLTFNLMYAWDLSLNVLSLCGLALSMGMLADNGIVVMESIFKHFEAGKDAMEAARAGTADVSRAIIASTTTTVAVFIPVVFIQSEFQDIIRELALAITFPLMASLLVALTLVPMLGARTLSRASLRPLGTGRLLEMYTVVLKANLRHRVRLAVAVAVALLATLIAAFFLMLQQQSLTEESGFTVYISLDEGATLDATDAAVIKVEQVVSELDDVETFTTSVQEAQGSVNVTLVDRADYPDRMTVDMAKEALEDALDDIDRGDVDVDFDPPASGGGGGGGRSGGGGGGMTGGFSLGQGATPETVVVRGSDFATLQMIADDLEFRLEEVLDVNENSISVDLARSGPEVQVIPDAMAMFDRQLAISTVLGAISQANPRGVQTSTAYLEADGTETPIEVRYIDDIEEDPIGLDELRQLPILTPAGEYTPIEEVARVRTDEGRNTILRTDQSRRVVLTYRFTDEVSEAQPRIDAARAYVRLVINDMILPPGYTIEVTEAEVDTIYYWMMGIAAILVYMILASLFESFSSPIVIFCTLPTAVIGSCMALLITGTGLTSEAGPMALLGFVVLIGIAVNNGIILIDAVTSMRKQGFRRERAVLTAGRSRVRPILMTSSTTLLGVFPLTLSFGGDFEIWPPFAITVVGGLAVSMVSTLIFVPVAYMGIDQVTDWLRRMGWLGVGIASSMTMAATYGVQYRYESYFWTSIFAVPLWFLFLTSVWTIMRAHHTRVLVHTRREPVYSVELHTLTKIYGAPGRFRRDWGRFERRARRMLDEGLEVLDRGSVKDGLIWKLPVLALLIFLHTYVTAGLALFAISVVTWGLLVHLVHAVGSLVLEGSSRAFLFVVRYGFLTLFLYYTQRRLDAWSLTITCAVLFFAVRGVRWLARQVEAGKVDIEDMIGRVVWLRRPIYRIAAKTPIIGAKLSEFTALRGINLTIGRGMFGLLGPNGAGKTTMMRIITRVLEPTFGSVSVNGVNLAEHEHLQGLIGYLPQHFGSYNHMTGYEYLEYRALLEGFKDSAERKERIMDVLEQVNLVDRKEDTIGSYSGGMRQRIGIAQTLLHTPQIMVVDEPTAGLDPVERIRFRNLLARLSKDRIVIFSTHIVEDVAGSCNRLAVINNGQCVYAGTPQVMREQARGKVWEAVLEEDFFNDLEHDLNVITHLRTPAGIRVHFLANEAPTQFEAKQVDPSLEDAYIYLLGEHRGVA